MAQQTVAASPGVPLQMTEPCTAYMAPQEQVAHILGLRKCMLTLGLQVKLLTEDAKSKDIKIRALQRQLEQVTTQLNTQRAFYSYLGSAADDLSLPFEPFEIPQPAEPAPTAAPVAVTAASSSSSTRPVASAPAAAAVGLVKTPDTASPPVVLSPLLLSPGPGHNNALGNDAPSVSELKTDSGVADPKTPVLTPVPEPIPLSFAQDDAPSSASSIPMSDSSEWAHRGDLARPVVPVQVPTSSLAAPPGLVIRYVIPRVPVAVAAVAAPPVVPKVPAKRSAPKSFMDRTRQSVSAQKRRRTAINNVLPRDCGQAEGEKWDQA